MFRVVVVGVAIVVAGAVAAAERVLPIRMSGLVVGSEIVVDHGDVTEAFITVRKGPRIALHALLDKRGDTIARWGRGWPWLQGDEGPLPVTRLALKARTGHPAVFSCGRDLLGACYRVEDLVWGSCFVWLDPQQRMRAAYVPNPIAPLVAAAAEDEERVLRLAARHSVRELQRKIDAAVLTRSRVIAIRGVTLVDPLSPAPLRNAVVVIEGERIRDAGVDVSIPDDAFVIEGGGATVLPGLWDSHAHMKHAAWGPAYLAVGITSVRDLGGDLASTTELRDRFAERGAPGPAMHLAGFIDAASDPPYTAVQANTAADARALVERFRGAGYDQIKIWENLQPEVVRELASQARRAGMPLTGHVPPAMSVYGAVEAGLTQINHSDALLEAAKDDPAAIGRFLRERNVVVEPTLVVGEFHWRDIGRPLSELEPDLARVRADMRRANEGLHPMTGDAAAGNAMFRRNLALVRALRDAGVTLLAGSDQGIPGYSLLRELELLAEAGLTNLEAIQAATSTPARVFGDHDGGSIAKGKRADLVLIDGDPLTDLRVLRRPRIVFRRGIPYDPERLRTIAHQ
ncbi:MAG TPA: amidohydrolase family protein [Thermoanaerobaculia bacterium]|nr:amidohydrolase family protein [Thermoanaerobaculia bacterium]